MLIHPFTQQPLLLCLILFPHKYLSPGVRVWGFHPSRLDQLYRGRGEAAAPRQDCDCGGRFNKQVTRTYV